MAKQGRFIVWLSTAPAFSWWVRNVASRLDPAIFKATNGRFTSLGPPAVPMLTLTTVGRRTGQPRSVHLACVEHDGDHLVVASAMGQQAHPSWRYNIEADPEVQVQLRGESFAARARVLSDAERSEVWNEIREAIPQLDVYAARTDRNIRVIRLSRAPRPLESAALPMP